MTELFYWLDLFGVAVFALSGALMAGRYQLDPFGVIVLAAVTAIGGGTIRDVVLGAYPVFWVAQPVYLLVIAATAIATIIIIRQPKRIPKRFLLIADAFGLALFAVLGTEKALSLGAPTTVAIVMGVITGVAGGMTRDVLCNVVPLILRQEIYAIAALVGGGLYVLLDMFGWQRELVTLLAISGALSLRLAAIYWRVSLPAFQINDSERDN